jgi:hypothetical protein
MGDHMSLQDLTPGDSLSSTTFTAPGPKACHPGVGRDGAQGFEARSVLSNGDEVSDRPEPAEGFSGPVLVSLSARTGSCAGHPE